MFPTYEGFHEDLKAMRDLLLAAQRDFLEKAKKNDLSEISKNRYDQCKTVFERSINALNTLLSSDVSAIEKEQAWSDLNSATKNNKYASADYDVNDASSDFDRQLNSFNKLLENDNERRVYRAQKNIYGAFDMLEAINCKHDFASTQDAIKTYNSKNKKWLTELNAFDGKLKFSSAYDFNAYGEKLKNEAAKLNEEKKMYTLEALKKLKSDLEMASQENSVKVKDLMMKEAYCDGELTRLGAEMKELNRQLEEEKRAVSQNKYENELREIDAQIEKYNNELSALRVSLGDATTARAIEKAKQEELRADKETAINNIRYIASSKKPIGNYDAVTGNNLVEMAIFLNNSMEFNQLRDELYGKLSALANKDCGLVESCDPTSEQRQLEIKAFDYGKGMVATTNKKLLDTVYNSTTLYAKTSIDMARLFDEYMKIYVDMYNPSEEEKESFEKNIACPTDLLRAIEKTSKAYTNLAQKMADGSGLKPEKIKGGNKETITKALSALYAKYTASDITKDRAEYMQTCNNKVESLENQVALKESDIAALKKKRENLYMGGNIKKLEERVKELEEKAHVVTLERDGYKNIINTLNDDTTAKKNAFTAFSNGKNNNLEAIRVNQENTKVYNETAAKINKLHNGYKDMIESGRAVYKMKMYLHGDENKQHGDKSFLARKAVNHTLQRYMDSKHYQMEKGHTDSDEFKNMIKAVKALTDSEGKDYNPRINYLPLNEVKAKLETVAQMARAYINRRERDHLVLIPSAQRKYRLDFARQLESFGNEYAKLFGGMAKIEKETGERYENFNNDFKLKLKGEDSIGTTYQMIKANLDKRSASINNNAPSAGNQDRNIQPVNANDKPQLS